HLFSPSIKLLYLLIDKSKYAFELSIPMYLLFNLFAAIPVVLLPQKGSKIKSFSLVDAKIILSKRFKGFCVGCFPCFFSDGFVIEVVQTSFICLLPFICFITS